MAYVKAAITMTLGV